MKFKPGDVIVSSLFSYHPTEYIIKAVYPLDGIYTVSDLDRRRGGDWSYNLWAKGIDQDYTLDESKTKQLKFGSEFEELINA